METEIQSTENASFQREVHKLRVELDKLRGESVKLRGESDKLKKEAVRLYDENENLKNMLYQQIYNEKLKIIDWTTKNLSIFFRSTVVGELNKLTAFEHGVRWRINNIRNALMNHNISMSDEIYAKLNQLSALTDQKVAQVRSQIQSAVFLTEPQRAQLNGLKRDEVTNEQVRAITRKNSLEKLVGLKILNISGILLLILGLIGAARYSYLYVPDLLKGIIIFIIGILMVGVGEISNRKKESFFSFGISAGGVSILYVALVASYFSFHIINASGAFVIYVLITASALLLANRYNSRIIAVFALVGGYLPIISLGESVNMIYGVMVCFVMLNLFALLIAFRKKWFAVAFIGLGLNIIGTSYIGITVADSVGMLAKVATIFYVGFTFLIYLIIPTISTYRTKTQFRQSDKVLLAINSFCSSLIMCGVFYKFSLQDFDGLFALGFATIYLLLGRWIGKRLVQEDHVKVLFYIIALVFLVLFIPLHWGRIWLSMGWLIEGVLLAVYGIMKNKKALLRGGYVISLLCLLVFFSIDLSWTDSPLFIYKYSALTLGSLVILVAYMVKKLADPLAKVYMLFVLSNVWFYTLYSINKIFREFYPSLHMYRINYLMYATMIVATFLIAYAVSRIKPLAERGTKVFSLILYIFGIIWMFILNIDIPLSGFATSRLDLNIILGQVGILATLGLFSGLALRDMLKVLMQEKRLNAEGFALIVAGYIVALLTLNLMAQFDFHFSSFMISMLFILTSLVWIVIGFNQRYGIIRRCGLGLAVFAVVKLFIFDLDGLTEGYRILAYFSLALFLLAISFVYQYFSKKLEQRIIGASNVPKETEESEETEISKS